MPRVIWKGAINFGLVHVPVVVHPATRSSRLDFDWIDRRDNAPVGYQRINKRTGKPIDSENIVKGYQYEKGEYVFLSDEDFRQANTAATQSVDILSFVDAAEVPIYYYDTPYYLLPDRRGGKGYALLHQVLRKSGRVGIASVVLHTRQHLAALMALDEGLLLITMRYAHEMLPIEQAEDGQGAKRDKPTARELEMAMRLVEDMSEPWDPEQYHDTYRDDLLAMIDKKIRSGKTHELTEAQEDGAPRRSAKVIDLVAVLQKSLKARGGEPADKPARKRAPAKTARKTRSPAPSKAAKSSGAGRAGARKTAAKRAGKTAARKAA
ncbi:Ku protein [Orrella sp. JC864]|uniref:non-homologous end joining protein Ku n=1 Tax=Orrella sp. JC864 TaxID=3120298 RepID=UPI00300991F8